ncbi:DEAD/DEAH box helicase [Tabrizicola soli]|uniref:DEAD/DEAH box helicase n=1 Tax=Tabrizicola soli TaxID=2185115 RepID=A0ABV7DZD9_9RHOB|nr:DEAD/DEAH box helicase family protein [Tabrizicola soli]
MAARDYQTTAKRRAFAAIKGDARAPVITLPTGTGKGTLEAETAVQLAQAGKRVVVTVPREEIARDQAKRIRAAGGDPGIVAPWAPFEPWKTIQVAMAPTLAKRWDKLPVPDVVLIDECHHSPADGYMAFLNGWPDAYRIGFTATLWRLDGKGFQGIFDAHIDGPPPAWFVEQGYLTDVDVWAPFVPDMRGVSSRGGDFDQEAMEAALERSRVFGNAVLSFQRYVRPGGTAVAFCCSKKHAEMAAAAFNAAGIPAEVLLGEDQGEVRSGKLARLARGETRVLCCVDVISEGFDLPSIDACLLMRPTQSLSLYLQQVGRVLRTVYADGFDLDTMPGRLAAIAAGPKPRATVVDCAGNWHRHGHPLKARTWCLEGEEPTRKKHTHTEDGEDISSRRCDACLQVYQTPATVCPYCGTEHGPDPRIPAAVAAEMRLVQRQEEEAAHAQAQKAIKRERFYEGKVRALRSAGAKNAKFAAFHQLQGRAMKAVKDGRLEEAIAIGVDLAESGFKEHAKLEELREALRVAMAPPEEQEAA